MWRHERGYCPLARHYGWGLFTSEYVLPMRTNLAQTSFIPVRSEADCLGGSPIEWKKSLQLLGLLG